MTRIDSFTGEYDFLSNFYPCSVKLDGITYPSVEHAYQAAKTLDPVFRDMIREAVRPGYAKRLGRMAPLREGWHDIRLEVMRELCWQKFHHPRLRQALMATGSVELIEGNTWGDTFWGVCRGVGENNLGLILMNIRTRVRERSPDPIPAT